MLTYSSQLTTIEDLIKQYKNRTPSLVNRKVILTLSKGFALDNGWNIKQLKKGLKKDNLDGLAFFTHVE